MRRERVAVLTQGTLTDAEMVAATPEAAYLMALAELPVPGKWVAVCGCEGERGKASGAPAPCP